MHPSVWHRRLDIWHGDQTHATPSTHASPAPGLNNCYCWLNQALANKQHWAAQWCGLPIHGIGAITIIEMFLWYGMVTSAVPRNMVDHALTLRRSSSSWAISCFWSCMEVNASLYCSCSLLYRPDNQPSTVIKKVKKVKGLDIYIPPLTGKPWPAAVYSSKWRTDWQWH